MFRIEGFLDDSKVAKTMRALDGLCYDLKVVPVKNAALKGGKVVDKGEATTARDAVILFIKRTGATEFRSSEAIQFGQQLGFTDAAVTQSFRKLVDDKIISRKARGHYVTN